MTTRRRLLAAAGALTALPAQLVLAQTGRASAPDDPRFVFVLLRGGMALLFLRLVIGEL